MRYLARHPMLVDFLLFLVIWIALSTALTYAVIRFLFYTGVGQALFAFYIGRFIGG